jgi:hypothetical protein
VGTDGWGDEGDRLAASPPTGFKIASLILMILGGALFFTGLFPCLGWLNWFGVPINGLAVLVGILGLSSGPKNPNGTQPYQGYYVAAMLVGGIGFIGGVLRCVAGAGLL